MLLAGIFSDAPNSQICVVIDIFDNDTIEFDELFIVTANSPDSSVDAVTATIIIMDKDGKYTPN